MPRLGRLGSAAVARDDWTQIWDGRPLVSQWWYAALMLCATLRDSTFSLGYLELGKEQEEDPPAISFALTALPSLVDYSRNLDRRDSVGLHKTPGYTLSCASNPSQRHCRRNRVRFISQQASSID